MSSFSSIKGRPQTLPNERCCGHVSQATEMISWLNMLVVDFVQRWIAVRYDLRGPLIKNCLGREFQEIKQIVRFCFNERDYYKIEKNPKKKTKPVKISSEVQPNFLKI